MKRGRHRIYTRNILSFEIWKRNSELNGCHCCNRIYSFAWRPTLIIVKPLSPEALVGFQNRIDHWTQLMETVRMIHGSTAKFHSLIWTYLCWRIGSLFYSPTKILFLMSSNIFFLWAQISARVQFYWSRNFCSGRNFFLSLEFDKVRKNSYSGW